MDASGYVLPGTIVRSLSDREYEKKKTAAIEIEQMMKGMLSNGDDDGIDSIMTLLVRDFAQSPMANIREGGLIGLAATAVGLASTESGPYLRKVVPPVLKCFSDQDERVRYYACESLYNIVKVARGTIIEFFNDLFDRVCTLSADPNPDVRGGALVLDRLVKDVVAESDTFDIQTFMPSLCGRLKQDNPYIRQFLIGWILMLEALDSVLGIELIKFLPEFLDGLFNYVSDPNWEIREQVGTALEALLRNIHSYPDADLRHMVPILVECCGSKHENTIITAMSWIKSFVGLGRERLLEQYGDILTAILKCTARSGNLSAAVQDASLATNKVLLTVAYETDFDFEIEHICTTLTRALNDEEFDTLALSVSKQWFSMLHEKVPDKLSGHLENILPALLHVMPDKEDRVRDVEVLTQTSGHARYFPKLLRFSRYALRELHHEFARILELETDAELGIVFGKCMI